MLRERMAVLVPGTMGVAGPLAPDAQDAVADDVAGRMAGMFGGATVEPVTGFYVANDGQTVKERILRVVSYCDRRAAKRHGRDVLDLARQLAKALRQESVAVERGGGMEFVA